MKFIQGSEIMGVRVSGKTIEIWGKHTNYSWINVKDLSASESEILKKKFGEKWSKEHDEALVLKDNMTEIEIAEDLSKDMKLSGWKMVRKTWV